MAVCSDEVFVFRRNLFFLQFDLVRKRLTKELKLLSENPTPGMYVELMIVDIRSICFYCRRIVDDGSDMRK